MNGFESVNLDSTVLEERPARPVLLAAVLESDDEDLNPNDFITSESHVYGGGSGNRGSGTRTGGRNALASESESTDVDDDDYDSNADADADATRSHSHLQSTTRSHHDYDDYNSNSLDQESVINSHYTVLKLVLQLHLILLLLLLQAELSVNLNLNVNLIPNAFNNYGFSSPPPIPSASLLDDSTHNMESSLLMNQTSILHFPKPPNIDGSGDNMVEFMLRKCRQLEDDLANQARMQNIYIKDGNPKLDITRNRIAHTLARLLEAYYSLHELYQREKTYVSATYNSFRVWDNKRSRLLHKIAKVKSTSNKYGRKLAALLDDSYQVDNEIADLELKLESLRNKKTALNAEITSTSSILESKTSRHVTLFRDLDSMGYDALTTFLNELGVPADQIDNVIKFSPVDVTFMHRYRELNHISSNDTITKIPAQTKTEPNINSQPNSDPIGMQVYNPPPETDTQPEMAVPNSLSPFEKGFAKGSKSSKKLRNQLASLVHNYISNDKPTGEQKLLIQSQAPKTSDIQVDDETNTVSSKLNVDPILNLLSFKMRALDDLDLQVSKKAANFHQCDNAWSDLQQVLAQQERKLLSYLEASTNMQSEGVKNTTVSIIESSINQIQKNLESNNFSAFDSTLKVAIINEISALVAAIKLVANVDLSTSLEALARLGITEETLADSDKSPRYQQPYSHLVAGKDSTTISNDLAYFGVPLESVLEESTAKSPFNSESTNGIGSGKQIKKE